MGIQQVHNTIYRLKGTNINYMSKFQDLTREVEGYFRYLFKEDGRTQIEDIMMAIRLYPTFFSEEDNVTIEGLVSMEEINIL